MTIGEKSFHVDRIVLVNMDDINRTGKHIVRFESKMYRSTSQLVNWYKRLATLG